MKQTPLKLFKNSNFTKLLSSLFLFASHSLSSSSSTSFMCVRRRNNNVDWSSLGMRGSFVINTNNLSMIELGLSKELREMLPIVIFKESFTINDSQCSVCLGDYQAEEKLQQIPSCGHTFHMDCIDLWLTSHSTCPLCRLCLIPKLSLDRSHQSVENVSPTENTNVGALAQQSIGEEVVHNVDEGPSR